MREENERAAAELAKLKARNMAGMLRPSSRTLVIKGPKDSLFKGKLLGKVAARGKAAEEEARRKEAEAEELARQMALAEEEERERLAAEKARLEREAEEARKRAEEESKPKVRPVFGCQFAFSEDLRFDPFSEEQRPPKPPMMGPAAVELQKSLDVFGEKAWLRIAYLTVCKGSSGSRAGRSSSMMMSSSTSKIRKCMRRMLSLRTPMIGAGIFREKFDDDFADRDKVDKALLVKSDQSQAERDRALEKVLAQSARLYASLGGEGRKFVKWQNRARCFSYFCRGDGFIVECAVC